MTRISNRTIKRLLTGGAPEPPEDLRQRLLDDLPEELHGELGPRRGRRIIHLAAAASLAAMIGGGFLAYTFLRSGAGNAPLGTPITEQPRSIAVQNAQPTSAKLRLDEDRSKGTPRPLIKPQERPDKLSSPAPERNATDETIARAAPVEEVKKKDESSGRQMHSRETDRIQEQETPPTSRPTPIPMRKSQQMNVGGEGQNGFQSRSKRVFAEEIQITPNQPQAPPSTGGTTEPNDRPYGDVFYRGYGVNPFVDTEDDHLSTFGLDVDTGSWGVLQRYLRDGHLPPPDAIRVEEIVNALDYGDPTPRRQDFRIAAEGSRDPWAPGPRYRLVRFGIAAREVSARNRPPAILTFVVDTSGSMNRGGRLELVKDALDLLLDELGSQDSIAVVAYSNSARVVLEPTSDRYRVRRALHALTPHGSTNVEAGLMTGYTLARRAFERGAVNRVILCSDGVGNVGATSPEAILARLRDHARDGIELTAVGVGMGNYNDVLLERLADAGDGRYVYVNDLDAARKVFSEELMGTLLTVAEEARAQVEFNPDAVSRWRLIGYENRDISDDRFRDPSVDAGEIGAGHTVTALYEVKLNDNVRRGTRLATLHLRWRPPGSTRFDEIQQTIRVREVSKSWDRASRRLQAASLAARFAEVLRHSFWAKTTSLGSLAERARLLHRRHPGDRSLSELASAIRRAAEIQQGQQPLGPDSDEPGR